MEINHNSQHLMCAYYIARHLPKHVKGILYNPCKNSTIIAILQMKKLKTYLFKSYSFSFYKKKLKTIFFEILIIFKMII